MIKLTYGGVFLEQGVPTQKGGICTDVRAGWLKTMAGDILRKHNKSGSFDARHI